MTLLANAIRILGFIFAMLCSGMVSGQPEDLSRALIVQDSHFSSLRAETQELFGSPLAEVQPFLEIANFQLVRQRRIMDIRSKGSDQLPSSSVDPNSLVTNISFFGGGIDENLLQFYEFLLNRDPAFLKPIVYDQEIAAKYCYGRYDTWLARTTLETWASFQWNDRLILEFVTRLQSSGWDVFENDKFIYGIPVSEYDTIGEMLGLAPSPEASDLHSFDIAKQYYRQEYLEGPGFDEIHDPRVRAQLLATSVIHGPETVTRWLQNAVGAKSDGILGEFTRRAANAAEPEALIREIIETGIQDRRCYHSSAAAHAYGTFIRRVPPSIEERLLPELEKYASAPALPGLETSIVERVIVVPDSELLLSSEDCSRYRVDNAETCYLGEVSGRALVAGQGVEIRLALPQHISDQIIQAYIDSIRGTINYQSGLIVVEKDEDVVVQRHSASHSSRFGAELESFVCNEENSNSSSEIDNIVGKYFDSRDAFYDHIDRYGSYFYDGWFQSPNFADDYVQMVLIDHFPDLHPDELIRWLEKSEEYPPHPLSPCLSETGEDWHALFGLGLLAAKRNEFGIVGLLPELSFDLFDPKHVESLKDFEDIVDQLIYEKDVDQGRRNKQIVLVPIDIPDAEPGQPSRYADLRTKIEHLRDRVLFVVAAGQPKTLGESPTRFAVDCQDIPMCLGYHSNVITVAAMELSLQDDPPRLSEFSNYGGPVEVMAPGAKLLSIDVFDDGNHQYPTLSIQSGTSFAISFVAALANEIWAREGQLDATHVKERIVGTAKGYFSGLSGDLDLHLLDGANTQVKAGAIDPARAVHPPFQSRVEYWIAPEGQSPVMTGKLFSAADQGLFVMFASKYSNQEDGNFICRWTDLVRIHRHEENDYSVVCSGTASDSYRTFVTYRTLRYIRGSLISLRTEAMPCLYGGNCLWLISEGATEIPIDLRNVRDIFFQVSIEPFH